MSTWVDPNLLTLVGLGTADDKDVPDGRHLRWFFGRYVGFPRSGFVLSRHPSLVGAVWDPPNINPLIHGQPTDENDVGFGLTRRFASGLTISKVGGFAYRAVALGSPPMMRVDGQEITLDFGPAGPGPSFPPGPNLSNPAAFVRLTVSRRRMTGRVVVNGYYNAHPELRYQDGARLRPTRGPNTWVTETLLLKGSLIERVLVTGADAVLRSVQWVTVREYGAAPGWQPVDTFLLPLTDAPGIYPQWTTIAGEEVAAKRLALAPPNRNLPWDNQSQDVETNLKTRYLGETFAGMDDAMRLFLKGELADNIPQADVEVLQSLEEDPPSTNPEPMTVPVRPFDHLYAAASDPQIARILGLMTTDNVDPGGVYDYVVRTNVPPNWVRWSMFPSSRLSRAQSERDDICLAMATAIAMRPAGSPEPPTSLQARPYPDLNATPIPAQVELGWAADSRGIFENRATGLIFYELLRQHGSAVDILHHKDDDTGLLLPHLPTRRQPFDGRLRLIDRSVPEWGVYTWSLRGMDLWGRFSGESTATADVRDTIPPPAPTALNVQLTGDASDAPVWPTATISFDWTHQQTLITPDLDHFEMHLVQHTVDRSAEGSPSTWGRFEWSPGSAAPPVTVSWPALVVSGLPPGVTGSVVATTIPSEEGGGERIAVDIGPMTAPFDTDDVAIVSATVRAVDAFANESPFGAHADTRRFDETPPVVPAMPGDVRIAAKPDTLGLCALKIDWPALGTGPTRVLRGSGRALLAAAGTDMDSYAAMSRAERAAVLRSAALVHHDVFTPDHEHPYPGGAGSHVAQLNANETGLTVFTVQASSAAGVRPAWPTAGSAFVVAAAPVSRLPVPPMITEVRAGDRSIAIFIAGVDSGDVTAFRLHRSRDSQTLDDVRTMRVVAEIPSSTTSLEVADTDLYPDIDYWYRAVAIGPEGVSPPSAAVVGRAFSSQPPVPPVINEARRMPAGHVRITAHVNRRDLPILLQRRPVGVIVWRPTAGPGIAQDGRLDTAVFPSQLDGDGYQLTIEDQAPSGTVFRYRMTARDPRGVEAHSNQQQEEP
jgi:hypothetical protein